jgi:hypothetical protein
MPALWFEVEIDAAKRDRRFGIFDTGQAIDSPLWKFCGTVIDGAYVWHVYEWTA